MDGSRGRRSAAAEFRDVEAPNLPPHLLSSPFTYAEALSAGATPGRLRSRALRHPFRGVRSLRLDMSSPVELCRAYAAKMPPSAVFSHTTAVRLWGMPLPLALSDEIHVTVPVPHRAPTGKGIIGHQQRIAHDERVYAGGLAVASPAATWAQLGELLSLDDLIAVGEHIITGNPYEKRLPLAELAELHAAIALRSRGRGHRIRVAALADMREGAFSRPETFVRLLLVRCGVPDPVSNADVLNDAGGFIAMPDLQWREYRVALEYHGDQHREQRRFRSDIARLEKLLDAGWWCKSRLLSSSAIRSLLPSGLRDASGLATGQVRSTCVA